MSTISFPIERLTGLQPFRRLGGSTGLQVSIDLTQDQKREVLKQLGATVSGETLAQWLKEDFAWDVTDMEVTE